VTDAAEIAEILTAFTEEQRRAALNQHRWRKITVARVVGDTQIQCETVVDQEASATEIFEALAPLDAAIDRLKAKSDLSDHYGRIASCLNEIEMSAKAHARDRHEFSVKNAKSNQQKRIDVGLTAQQNLALQHHRDSIKERFARIEELQASARETMRIVGGEDPFAVVAEQIAKRLDAVRGERQDAA
jgi:hypothetical protein